MQVLCNIFFMKFPAYGFLIFVLSYVITVTFLCNGGIRGMEIFVYEYVPSLVHQSAVANVVSYEEEIQPKEDVRVEDTVIPSPEITQEPVFEPSEVLWQNATMTAEWAPRDSATTFVFKDKMWIIGGLNGNNVATNNDHQVHYWEAPYFTDAWSSTDGITWLKEKENIEWGARRSMSVVSFNNSLWMLGGWSPRTGYTNDIWKSEDGIHWVNVVKSASWPAREGQTVEVFQNKLWLIGGVNYDDRDVKKDIWYSDDGLVWNEVSSSTIPWSARWDHAVAVFDGALYLAGGMNLSKDTFNDVWLSYDGLNWELVTEHAPWQSRQGHGLVSFKDALWSIGRLNDDVGGGKNDVWYMSKGNTDWKKTNIDPEWLGREDHGVVVFNDSVYVLGGMDSNWTWRNDVWKIK